MPRRVKSGVVPMLRVGHLRAFTRALEETGAPVGQYLSKHGLPLHLEGQDGYVPLARVWSFLSDVAHREDPMFGWRCGSSAGDRPIHKSVLGILESAPSLYEALLGFTRLVSAEATHLQLDMRGRGADVLICVCYPGMQDIPGYNVAQAYQLEVILGVIRHYLGPGWSPAELGIECASKTAEITQYFPATRILTGQRCGYLAIPRTLLYRPLADTGLEGPDKSGEVIQTEFDLVDALKRMLHAYLPDGYPSAQFAANLFGISARTLERRLARQGTSYGEVVDNVRYDRARGLLEDPDLHIGEISSVLGFTDQRNFARMFRRVSGLSPGEYRNELATKT